jgi:hypothetical protein
MRTISKAFPLVSFRSLEEVPLSAVENMRFKGTPRLDNVPTFSSEVSMAEIYTSILVSEFLCQQKAECTLAPKNFET